MVSQGYLGQGPTTLTLKEWKTNVSPPRLLSARRQFLTDTGLVNLEIAPRRIARLEHTLGDEADLHALRLTCRTGCVDDVGQLQD